MQRVWIWVTRNADGQVEQHVGPFEQPARDKQGRRLTDEHGQALSDSTYAEAVHKAVAGYDEQNARDVAAGLESRDLERDKTGATRSLAQALADISARVIDRQQRAESRAQVEQGGRAIAGFPPLRAIWLADIELAQMTIHVRAE